jgi:hypothetical protein
MTRISIVNAALGSRHFLHTSITTTTSHSKFEQRNQFGLYCTEKRYAKNWYRYFMLTEILLALVVPPDNALGG